MAEVASQNMWVKDADGIRRLVAAGSPIPKHMGMEVEGEVVPTRELAVPVVDEEASKSHAERTGTTQPTREDGLVNTVTDLRAGGSKSSRASKPSKPDNSGD